MTNLKAFIVEFEVEKHFNLLNTENVKRIKMYNHNDYPIVKTSVKEFKKQVGKELIKLFKNNSMHDMVTVYGYDNNYGIVNLSRFTYDIYNGAIHVQFRPYDEHKGFEVQVEKAFETYTDAKKYILKLVESYIYENIDVKEDSENYWTKHNC